jgi:hypothetical protein
MCPICITATTLLAWGSASTGGVAAVAAAAWHLRQRGGADPAPARPDSAMTETEEAGDEE